MKIILVWDSDYVNVECVKTNTEEKLDNLSIEESLKNLDKLSINQNSHTIY